MKKFYICLLLLLLTPVMEKAIQAQVDLYCYFCAPAKSINSDTFQDIRLHMGLEGTIYDLSFALDSQSMAVIRSGTLGRSIKHISIYANTNNGWGTTEAVFFENRFLTQVLFDSTMSEVIYGDSKGTIEYISLETKRVDYAFQVNGAIGELLLHGDKIIFLEGNIKVGMVDRSGNMSYLSIPSQVTFISSVSISADSNWLAVTTPDAVLIYDLSTQQLQTQYAFDDTLTQTLFSPQNSRELIVVGTAVYLWQWEDTTEPIITFKALEPKTVKIVDGAINTNGDVLATTNSDNCLQIWDLKEHLEVKTPLDDWGRCSDTFISEIKFSPDDLWFMWSEDSLIFWVVP